MQITCKFKDYIDILGGPHINNKPPAVVHDGACTLVHHNSGILPSHRKT